MSDFTQEQIKAFRNLAQKYDKELFNLLTSTSWATIRASNDAEAEMFEAFSNKICRLVLRDYPDYVGKHADINADAEMVTFMIADVLADYRAGTAEPAATQK